jgi:putative transposase
MELGNEALARVNYTVKNQPLRELDHHVFTAGVPVDVTVRSEGAGLVPSRNLVQLKGESSGIIRPGRRRSPMKRSRYSSEQITFALHQAENGVPATEVCRKMGISEQTFYRWKKQFAGMGVAEVRRLKVLEEENHKLKQLVADLSLDKQMLQDVLRQKT